MRSMWKQKAPNDEGSGRMILRKQTLIAAPALAVVASVGIVGVASAHVPQVTPNCDTTQHQSTLAVQADSYNADHQNSVTITIDGGQSETYTFGSTFPTKEYLLSSTANHNYVVQFTAWDDPDSDGDGNGNEGWTKKFVGTINACEVPPEEPPEEPPHHDIKKPKAHLSTNCTGHAKAVLNNHRSNVKVPFFLTASKRTWSTGWKVTVRKHHVRKFNFNDRKFPVGTVVKVRANGKLLDKIKIPPRCPKPPHNPPDTGMRVAPSAQRTTAQRLIVPAIGVNARVVQVGMTKGGAQAVTHSVSDVFPLA